MSQATQVLNALLRSLRALFTPTSTQPRLAAKPQDHLMFSIPGTQANWFGLQPWRER